MSKYVLNKPKTTLNLASALGEYEQKHNITGIWVSDMLDIDRCYYFQLKGGVRFSSISLLYNICQLVEMDLNDILVFDEVGE